MNNQFEKPKNPDNREKEQNNLQGIKKDRKLGQNQNQNLKKVKLMGLVLFLLSIIFLIFKITIPGIEFQLELKHKEYPLNLTPLVSYIVLIISLILLNRELPIIPNIPLEEEIKKSNIVQSMEFKSIPRFRIIVLIFEFIFIFVNAKLFGTGILEETHLGQWFVLGGPSVFWPMSILYILSIPFLLIIIITSIGTLKITEYETFYKLDERKLLGKSENFVLKNDIQELSIYKYNNPFYPEFLYIVIFGLHGVWQLFMAYPYFINPFTFGQGWVVAFGWFVNGLFEIILMIGMLLERSTTLNFSLNEVIYKYEIFLDKFQCKKIRAKNNKDWLEGYGVTQLQQFFLGLYQQDGDLIKIEIEKEIEKETEKDEKISTSWKKLVIGALLFNTGLMSRSAYVYAGHNLQYGLYFASLYILMIGLIDELNRLDISLHYEQDSNFAQINNFDFRLISTVFDKQLFFTKIQPVSTNQAINPKLKGKNRNYLSQLKEKRISIIWDILVLILMFYLIIDDMIGILKFSSDIPDISQAIAGHVFGDLFVLFLLFLAFRERFRIRERR